MTTTNKTVTVFGGSTGRVVMVDGRVVTKAQLSALRRLAVGGLMTGVKGGRGLVAIGCADPYGSPVQYRITTTGHAVISAADGSIDPAGVSYARDCDAREVRS
jgi:hypothetical protein